MDKHFLSFLVFAMLALLGQSRLKAVRLPSARSLVASGKQLLATPYARMLRSPYTRSSMAMSRVFRSMWNAEMVRRRDVERRQREAWRRASRLPAPVQRQLVGGQVAPEALAIPEVQEVLSAQEFVAQSEALIRDMWAQKAVLERQLPHLGEKETEQIIAGFQTYGVLYRPVKQLQRPVLHRDRNPAPSGMLSRPQVPDLRSPYSQPGAPLRR